MLAELIESGSAKAKQAYKDAKKILLIAAAIIVAMFVIGCIIATVHFIIYISKSVSKYYGPVGSCPYYYSSFGLENIESKPIIGTAVDEIVSIIYSNNNGQTSGILNGYRNNILNNNRFQIIKIMLVVFVIVLISVSFIFGFTKMTGQELLKRFVIIALVIWATQPGTYALYDDFIEPLVLRGSKQLTSFIAGSFLNSIDSPEIVAYIQRNPENEFVLMDAAITIFFSQTIFDKIGAALFTHGAMFLMSPLVYIVGFFLIYQFMIFAITVIYYKIVMVVGLSIFPLFALFGISFATTNSLNKFGVFFSNYIQATLIKPAIAIAILVLGMSIVTTLILAMLTGAFSFQVCIKTYWTAPAYLSFLGLGHFDYFAAFKPESVDQIAGTLMAFSSDAAQFTKETENMSNGAMIAEMITFNLIVALGYGVIFKKVTQLITEAVQSMGLGSSLAKNSGFSSDLAKVVASVEDPIANKIDSVANGIANPEDKKSEDGGGSSRSNIETSEKDEKKGEDDKSKPETEDTDKEEDEKKGEEDKSKPETDDTKKEGDEKKGEEDKSKPETDDTKKEGDEKEEQEDKAESESETGDQGSSANESNNSESSSDGVNTNGSKPSNAKGKSSTTEDKSENAEEVESGGSENASSEPTSLFKKIIKRIKRIMSRQSPETQAIAGVGAMAIAEDVSEPDTSPPSESTNDVNDTNEINEEIEEITEEVEIENEDSNGKERDLVEDKIKNEVVDNSGEKVYVPEDNTKSTLPEDNTKSTLPEDNTKSTLPEDTKEAKDSTNPEKSILNDINEANNREKTLKEMDDFYGTGNTNVNDYNSNLDTVISTDVNTITNAETIDAPIASEGENTKAPTEDKLNTEMKENQEKIDKVKEKQALFDKIQEEMDKNKNDK